ncbi:transporter substrate-binding domain-containing protein [Bordetella sp. BOR01]|uniref:transporter substrate-binding domain-containing protein n=1 Tax=Bordetella sp. BOR01 TaxID=2854779 RepID=UPI001C48ACA8|nr:transporter substrate-binding domain-containing protein [Bordetella sp. BOR01]MBV7486343.1 transporter substrate-binding domain-containing protein [Bordetella sp. BOR01]
MTVSVLQRLVATVLGSMVFFSACGADAQSGPAAARQVDVGVYVSAPFVEQKAEHAYSGMAIDLWQAVAREKGLTSRYIRYPTFRDLVQATASGAVDIAVTNLTISRQRAESVAFTQPWYDAGFRIMVPAQGGGDGFWGIVSGLKDAGHLQAYGWLLLIIIIATIGFTIFDRKFDPGFPRRWRDGIAESFYHVMSIATSGRTVRKNLLGWMGRYWQAAWLVFGVAVIAYITSSVTSIMTAASLTQNISSLSDLPGKTVAVFTGSTSEDYVHDLGIDLRTYQDIEAAVAALQAGEVDAVVGDAPVLEHYTHTNPGRNLTVVGNIFHPDKYGFAFPHESDLTLPVTLEILHLQEDGTLEKIRQDYFGHRR